MIRVSDWHHLDALVARNFPYSVSYGKSAAPDRYTVMNQWCVDRFETDDAWDNTGGKTGVFYPDCRWCLCDGRYHFKTERDAFEFKIRWG